MCCQIHVDEETEAILSAKFNSGVTLEKGLIRPNDKASLLTSEGMETMRWGFRTPTNPALLINARSESVGEKYSFRESFQNQRCIIPAAFFNEYDRYKEKVSFSLPSSPILFLAGIYTTHQGELRFTVLTTSTNSSVSSYHDRMPLLLEEAALEAYLFDRKEASRLLKAQMPPLLAKRESTQLEFDF